VLMEKKRDISALWKLHGSYYDFTRFQSAHPGGATLLMLGRGRDVTELWESVHQFAPNPEAFRHLFDKFRVEAVDLPPEAAAAAAQVHDLEDALGNTSRVLERVRNLTHSSPCSLLSTQL